MDDLFPHLGEIVLERIIRSEPTFVLAQVNVQLDDFVEIHRQVPITFPATNVMFDGFSTIDLALELVNETIVPIEVKLGHTGLARANMDQKLEACTISRHRHGARISGNILAVINRYFDPDLSALIGNDLLHAQLGNRQLALTEDWGIIARDHIIASWSNFAPRFNGKQVVISLETICRNFGHNRFNELIDTMLGEFDFFQTWIGNDV